MKYTIYIFLISILLLASCNTKKSFEVTIDNPSANEFSFSLNKKKYSIKALENKTLNIKKGKQYLFIKNVAGDTLLNDTLNIEMDGLLNPTKTTYVVWSDLYLENISEYNTFAKDLLNVKDSIMIEDKVFYDADFEVFEDSVFIEKSWDFGVLEDWAKEVDLQKNSAVKKSKIYRLEDLYEEWGVQEAIDYSDYSEEEFQQILDSLLNEEDLEIDSSEQNS